MTYAKRTKVPMVRSRAEVEALLRKRGAQRIATMADGDLAVVGFVLRERLIRFELRIKHQSGDSIVTRERREREMWRALLLCIKSKLVSVEAGVESIDEAFLAQVVTESGETVGREVLPRLAAAYSRGAVPLTLGPGGGSDR